MKLMMHILRNNDKLGIDNRTLTLSQIGEKLDEEFNEVYEELDNFDEYPNRKNLKNLIRETFDLIQICILILWRCHKIAKSIGYDNLIQEINIEHKDKLMGREWHIETGIEIDVKE